MGTPPLKSQVQVQGVSLSIFIKFFYRITPGEKRPARFELAFLSLEIFICFESYIILLYRVSKLARCKYFDS